MVKEVTERRARFLMCGMLVCGFDCEEGREGNRGERMESREKGKERWDGPCYGTHCVLWFEGWLGLMWQRRG